MPLDKAQKDVDEWTSQFTPQYFPPYGILARLMEEVGEISREINHLHGPKKRKKGSQIIILDRSYVILYLRLFAWEILT